MAAWRLRAQRRAPLLSRPFQVRACSAQGCVTLAWSCLTHAWGRSMLWATGVCGCAPSQIDPRGGASLLCVLCKPLCLTAVVGWLRLTPCYPSPTHTRCWLLAADMPHVSASTPSPLLPEPINKLWRNIQTGVGIGMFTTEPVAAGQLLFVSEPLATVSLRPGATAGGALRVCCVCSTQPTDAPRHTPPGAPPL